MNFSLVTGNTIVDQATAAVAATAVASPVWLPWLSTTSEVAAVIAPILGTIWLVVQIISKARELLDRRPRK